MAMGHRARSLAEMHLFHRWKQLRARRAGRKADEIEERGQRQQWFLLAGPCDAGCLTAPRPGLLEPIYPPSRSFWADPFLWKRDGRLYVFFEDYPYATRRGRIGALELDARGRPIGEAIPVLEEPYHLSFPFLFELGGELYMTPEKKATARLDVYRCDEFPHRWTMAANLFEGMKIADANLLEHEGRWWLFCAARQGRARISETLVAFHADHPLSRRWMPHPENPLVRDFSRARPGGRIFRDGQGRLLRPSQDCVRRYGYGIGINEITHLSTRGYAEHRIWYESGEHAGRWRAMHHMDCREGIMVMDAQRLIVPGGEPLDLET
jgi:hypothetical protein